MKQRRINNRSCTLVFKKNGVEILSLGAGHTLAVAFLDKPYDTFEPMSKFSFGDAMHTLIRQDESYEDDMEMLNRLLSHTSDMEEKWEIASRLRDIKCERREIEKAKVMLEMLEMIWEECGDDKSNLGLEWAVV